MFIHNINQTNLEFYLLPSQEVNLWKLMGDFNLHGITAPGIKFCYSSFFISWSEGEKSQNIIYFKLFQFGNLLTFSWK